MANTKGWAAPSAGAQLKPFTFDRREPGERDVEIEIAFCGICHSDVHQVKDEWGGATYPMVPGHEIAGRISRVGKKVKSFKTGDHAGVGCFVDSCRACANCKRGLEQFCEKVPAFTYNGTEMDRKTPTQGGYSARVVVDERYALKLDKKLPLERAAPLLCAGITTYSPLKRFGAKKGARVGVMGLGGLGHMAVKLAAAMGAETTVLSRTAAKKADAAKLGAHAFELTSDSGAAKRLAGRFDLIIDTISADHDVNTPLSWLKTQGTLCLVGAPPQPLAVASFGLIGGQKTLAGSMIGGLALTQEMLDFCAKKNVLADVEVIPMSEINRAYERMLVSDVRYRFSLDLSTL